MHGGCRNHAKIGALPRGRSGRGGKEERIFSKKQARRGGRYLKDREPRAEGAKDTGVNGIVPKKQDPNVFAPVYTVGIPSSVGVKSL